MVRSSITTAGKVAQRPQIYSIGGCEYASKLSRCWESSVKSKGGEKTRLGRELVLQITTYMASDAPRVQARTWKQVGAPQELKRNAERENSPPSLSHPLNATSTTSPSLLTYVSYHRARHYLCLCRSTPSFPYSTFDPRRAVGIRRSSLLLGRLFLVHHSLGSTQQHGHPSPSVVAEYSQMFLRPHSPCHLARPSPSRSIRAGLAGSLKTRYSDH